MSRGLCGIRVVVLYTLLIIIIIIIIIVTIDTSHRESWPDIIRGERFLKKIILVGYYFPTLLPPPYLFIIFVEINDFDCGERRSRIPVTSFMYTKTAAGRRLPRWSHVHPNFRPFHPVPPRSNEILRNPIPLSPVTTECRNRDRRYSSAISSLRLLARPSNCFWSVVLCIVISNIWSKYAQ